jgi:hypothetical protein
MSEGVQEALAVVALMMPGVLAGVGVMAWLVKRNAYGDYAPILGNPDNPEEIQRRWAERKVVMDRRIMRAWRVALIACPVLFVAIVVLLLVA